MGVCFDGLLFITHQTICQCAINIIYVLNSLSYSCVRWSSCSYILCGIKLALSDQECFLPSIHESLEAFGAILLVALQMLLRLLRPDIDHYSHIIDVVEEI